MRHLLSKFAQISLHLDLRVALLTLFCLVSPAANAQSFDRFSSFRYRVLELIGGAQKDVTLITEFLSDGEIVTALYLAKYRGLDIKVYLGSAKSNHPMSRLNYLNNQRIKAYLIPSDFPSQKGSLLYVDGALFTSPNDMDSRSPMKVFKLTPVQGVELQALLKTYQSLLIMPKEAIAGPPPQVGRAHTKGYYYVPEPEPLINMPLGSQIKNDTSSGESSYNYNRHTINQRKAPDGVPVKLPNQTVKQLRETDKAQNNANETPKF